MENVVEVVIFKVKPGVSVESVKEAAAKTLPFLQQFESFLRRELGVTPTGEWVDILHWADIDSAQHAAQAFMSAAECQDFMSIFDGPPVTVLHANPVMSLNADAAKE